MSGTDPARSPCDPGQGLFRGEVLIAQEEQPAVYILVGGRGTRLGHLTRKCPKPLLPIDGKPFLDYVLENLLLAGFRKIRLLAAYRCEDVERYIQLYRPPSLVESTNSSVELKLVKDPDASGSGTGLAVVSAVEALKEKGGIFVVNGDTLLPSDITEQAQRLSKTGETGVVVGPFLCDAAEYNLAFNPRDSTIRFDPKSPPPFSPVVDQGLYFFCPRARELMDTPRWADERRISSLNELLKALGRELPIKGVLNRGPYFDIGTPTRWNTFQEYVKSGGDMG